uniref:BHLH domain-containing protein n=1 Tax=Globodera pallida TaxID=36090 RepID=A0A183BL29_GLOPA
MSKRNRNAHLVRPGQMQSNCIYLNSRSPSISSDISFIDDDVNSSFFCDFESDVADADEISQIMLKEQLNQLRTEDFILQAHFKFATGTLDQQHNNLPSVAYYGDKYFDNFLDEQEEIKLMESPSLVEIPGIATPSYSLVSSPKLGSTEIEILDATNLMESASTLSQQKEKNQNEISDKSSEQRKFEGMTPLTNSSALKRRGRPTLKSGDYVYIPLTKSRMANSVTDNSKVVAKKKRRTKNALIIAARSPELNSTGIEMLDARITNSVISAKVAAKREKHAKEKSEKQLQRLELIRRMTQLRHLNPMASALRGVCLYEGDYFYRELLVGRSDPCTISEELEIDCVTVHAPGVAGGASMFHSLTMKNANRLRESLRLYSRSCQLLIVEVHGWLLKNLSQTRLISYLNLLRFLKNAGSNLGDYIITSSSEESELERANKCISEFLAQKLYEPPLSSSSKLIECDPIKNVSLVLVYPQINTKTSQHTIRAHETIFRNLLPLAVCCVEKIELNLNVDRPISVEECTWMCVRMIRQRVKEIAKRRQNDHIFLAGWGTACWLNHKSVDDQICLTYPATLFVVGEDAHNVNMKALKQLRRNMIADSGLIVIGSANHNMLVSPTVLSIERVSQFIIHKNIVEYVMQFIKQVVTDLGTPKECRQFLKPIKLPDIYEVDPAFFKAKPTTGPQRPRKPAEKKEKDENEDKLRNERKTSGLSQKAPFRHPTQTAVNLPAQLQPAIPTASSKYGTHLYSARHTFNTSLKSAYAESKTADSLKIPSPETLNRQIPPLLQGKRMPMPSSSSAFQETLREEEEAAAALAALK